ncbi:lanthionine synthetase LanC family protein [Smaragdicoccus niigatensis]|uniref:lanthionine synthetase LanC family protein n=1 Tax=Smaragdicoccus niigatensis TaxID=359359 RepID=UPI0003A841CA|nr:lanthionine synthetase LanC family protein [Smaragdicoccus niigatensis]
MTWRGLLRGEERQRAVGVAADIGARLRALNMNELNPGLCEGSAGIALALMYLDRVSGGDGSDADEFLGAAYESVSANPGSVGAGLANGISGIGWVGAHFDRLAGTPAESGGDMDHLLLPVLEEGAWPGPWELFYGLIGVGAYALEAGSSSCLARVLERLAEVPDEDGEWVTDTVRLFGPESGRPPRYLDLGMAHGVPGALALCSAAAGLGSARGALLAESAAKCLLAHEFPPDPLSRYPAVVEPGETPRPTHLAWCYGDASVAVALAAGGAVLSEAATRAAKAAAARTFEQSGVVDLGLCHGTAGVAQTMGRLACLDESVAPAARAWAVRLLGEAEAGKLPGEPGFLTGQAGVALALLAAAADEDPGWDRCLLLSSG